MTLDLKDYSSLQEELARVKRQAQEQAVAQGTRMSALMEENKDLREALAIYADKFSWRTNSGKIGVTLMTDGRDADRIDGHWTGGRLARFILANSPLTAQLSETERLRDAVVTAAKALCDDEDAASVTFGYTTRELRRAIEALDAHLEAERTEERG